MFHVDSIMNALYTSIASDAAIVSSGFVVELEPVNQGDMNIGLWCGVYFIDAPFAPGAMGGQQFDGVVDMSVVVRATDAGGRAASILALQRAVKPVLTAIWCNLTLGGTVDVIDTINIQPFEIQRSTEDFIQSYEIQLAAKLNGALP